jgi:hypothetical protein
VYRQSENLDAVVKGSGAVEAKSSAAEGTPGTLTGQSH